MATLTSVTKHFPTPKEGFTTTLASTIGSGAATVPLNSVTGYTNGDTVVMVVEPGNATNKQAFTGVVDTAGVQITNVVWTEGTNTTHTAGATVVDYVAATHMGMVSKGLLRDHNQSGYHKTLNDDNGNEWLKQTSVASAVNEVTLANAATGTHPSMSATGGDTNIDLKMTGKGTGKAYVDGFSEISFDFVASGLVWSGDSYGSTRAASMTAGVLYIGGIRVSVAAVTARTFTASTDTYIDISNAGTITYTEVANNAASPALAANNVRVGIIVTAAGSIAAVGSVNQGQEAKVLPIASSIPYAVTDSLGNLICPRDPERKLLGYRQVVANIGSLTSTTAAQLTGLSCPVIVPTNRKVKLTLHVPAAVPNANAAFNGYIFDGTIGGGGTQIASTSMFVTNSQASGSWITGAITTPASANKTYNAGYAISTGSLTLGASSTSPMFIKVELE